MKLLVNYADRRFRTHQARNSRSGLAVGRFDRVASFGPPDIDAEFATRNRHILNQPRGGGYWLWKPYFIRRELARLGADDVLFYCDAGAHFLAPIDPLIEVLRRDQLDVLVFELPFLEGDWTKREAFVALGCDRPELALSPQRLASFHLWRRSDLSLRLAEEWLEAAQDERLLTDLPNRCDLANYPGFREHRHDQSLFSLLTKKYGLSAYRDPSQYGSLRREEYPNSPYEQLIEHTRRGRPSLPKRLWQQVRRTIKQWKSGWERRAA
jgi:hypothetical protein